MKKLFTILALCGFVVCANAQISDDFESYTDFTINPTGIWSFYDGDAAETYGFNGISFENSCSPMAFIVFNPTTCSPALDGTTAHSGSKFLASFAATTPPNNDWLISPLLSGAAGTIDFYAASYTSSYGLERFYVAYSTTTTDVSAFTNITSDYVEAPVEWTSYSYSFPAGTKYVAIRCVSNDAFIFFLDDISVSTGVGIDNINSSKDISIYPNPATNVLNIEAAGYDNYQITNLLGQVVMTDAISNQAQVNVSNLNDGVYFVRLSGENGVYTQKFIKK